MLFFALVLPLLLFCGYRLDIEIEKLSFASGDLPIYLSGPVSGPDDGSGPPQSVWFVAWSAHLDGWSQYNYTGAGGHTRLNGDQSLQRPSRDDGGDAGAV